MTVTSDAPPLRPRRDTPKASYSNSSNAPEQVTQAVQGTTPRYREDRWFVCCRQKAFDSQRTRDEIHCLIHRASTHLTALPFCYAPYSRAARSSAIGPRSNARLEQGAPRTNAGVFRPALRSVELACQHRKSPICIPGKSNWVLELMGSRGSRPKSGCPRRQR